MYAHQDAGSWVIDEVDGPGAGYYTSIALDSAKVPHISYYDWSDDNLKYAYAYFLPYSIYLPAVLGQP